MASGFYSGLAAVASSLLDTFGQAVSFSRQTAGTFDPALGKYTGQSTVAFSGNGASFDYNSSEIDGKVIQRDDIRLMLEVTDTKPEIGDSCTIAAVAYRVMNVTESSPGGTVTHYELQLRK